MFRVLFCVTSNQFFLTTTVYTSLVLYCSSHFNQPGIIQIEKYYLPCMVDSVAPHCPKSQLYIIEVIMFIYTYRHIKLLV